MLRRFIRFVRDNGLVKKNDRVLLGVSGGVDSAVMADLFHLAGLPFGIAHCNFGLRGDESDADEAFVHMLAKKYGVPFHRKSFLSAIESRERQVSVQMSARDLRYEWFEEVREISGYTAIATGHQADDQIETFFINLLRGTGITGLHGILPKHGKVIRPMLFATREEIAAYAREHDLGYREDSSNRSRKYLRNRIRLDLIPLLKEMNPDITATMTGNIARLREAAEIFRATVEAERRRIMKKREGRVVIAIEDLKSLRPAHTWIYELFAPFGFNESTATDLAVALGRPEQKEFFSDTWKAVKDRGEVILTRRTVRDVPEPSEYEIPKGKKTVTRPLLLTFATRTYKPGTEIPGSREYATLDLSKLAFPLILRRWKPGDAFVPFGMTRKKKVSDFLTDAKVSAGEKRNTWVLCSGGRIAWVVGHRPDNRFRVTVHTRKILQIRLGGKANS